MTFIKATGTKKKGKVFEEIFSNPIRIEEQERYDIGIYIFDHTHTHTLESSHFTFNSIYSLEQNDRKCGQGYFYYVSTDMVALTSITSA